MAAPRAEAAGGAPGLYRVPAHGNAPHRARRAAGPLTGGAPLTIEGTSRARWQSGHAEDCKSSYVGSIPARASSGELVWRSAAGLLLRHRLLRSLIRRGAAVAQRTVKQLRSPNIRDIHRRELRLFKRFSVHVRQERTAEHSPWRCQIGASAYRTRDQGRSAPYDPLGQHAPRLRPSLWRSQEDLHRPDRLRSQAIDRRVAAPEFAGCQV